jgi:molecular chaperone Hsp33
LAETISSAELLDLPSETLLFKLYHEETVTLYPPTPILFKCRCSRERSANTIALLPESEKADILAELGEITLTCELCGTSYRFGQEVMNTAASTSQPTGGEARTLH